MSISTYAQLQTAVYRWILRMTTDRVVTSDQVQNYISLCESELNRELRVRELEESTTLSTVATQDFVNLPSDFRKVGSIYHLSSPFDIKTLPTIKDLKIKYSTRSERPCEATIYGTKIYLGPTPNAIYDINLDYYKEITALSDLNTTNVILTRYPDVYLYGAIRHAYINTRDEKNLSVAENNYTAAINRIKDADISSRMTHDTVGHIRNRLA